jgi:adenosine deaminase
LCSSMDVEGLIRALPKVEQHIHIVGSTRPETLLWLAQKGGKAQPFKSVEEAHHFFQYRSFSHFIAIYSMVVDCITDEEQFERIAYEMLESEARCNVRYVEASFSAPDHVLKGLDYGQMLDAINKGVRRARCDFGVECNLRIDLVRNYGPRVGNEVLDWIETKSDNIVSIDIGGSEEKFPAKPFAQVYRRAKKIGFHLVAHAGEVAGAQSVWEAVKDLGVEHVGHGLAASNDPVLMDHILEHGITIEACPISNVRTGVISSLETHPVRTFFERGINVTVNSDDPSMFDTDMNNEYLQLHRRLKFTILELFRLSLNAVDSSFLPQEQKTKLRESFIKEYERLLCQNYEI